MLLAAMLAMVLAAAAPAFAQATAIDEGDTTEGDDVQYNAVCQNILGSFGDITQTQSGDADAVAVDDSAAAAEVAQEQGVTIAQVNQCLNDFDEDGDGTISVDEEVVVSGGGDDDEGSASASSSSSASSSASASSSSSASSSASASSSSSASASAVLPETGGASLLALGAGALLVAGGLLARRIVR